MTTRKSIFKMVNLRGVDNNTVEPPTDPDDVDDDDGPIIEIVNNSPMVPRIDDDQALELSRQLEDQSIDNLIQLTRDIDTLVNEHNVNSTS